MGEYETSRNIKHFLFIYLLKLNSPSIEEKLISINK